VNGVIATSLLMPWTPASAPLNVPSAPPALKLTSTITAPTARESWCAARCDRQINW